MAEQEEDFSSLPLPDRFAHKNWKVRKEAYETATKAFDIAASESDPTVRTFLQDPGLWKAAVADSNVAAQQEALGALCSFLQIAGIQGCTRTRNLTITSIVEKGLAATRPAAKQKALEALLLYIELDKADPIVEELLPLLSHKQPKIIAATLAALTAIYHAYGVKVVEPKPTIKLLPKMFGHADKNVRAEATNLTVEFYRWIKEAMKPLFWNDLKPVQQTDLEKLFEKVRDEAAPKQERLLRSQQAAKAAAPAEVEGEVEEEEEEEAEIDLEPEFEIVNVFPKIPKDFQERISSTKWKDRKEALDDLLVAINHPRIEEGQFDDILRALAKCMKDANIAVVTAAANSIELLAKGLRRGFARYRGTVMSPMMERLKEKKQTVTDAIGAALDAVFATTNLTDCLEEVLEFLKHKNPQVKLESTRFLIRALKTTRDVPEPPQVKSIAEASIKLLTDSQETQRSAGAEVLGTLWKIMGDRPMLAHLEGLDEIRKTKIKEFYEAAEVKAKFKPKVAPPPKPAPAANTKRMGMVGKKPAAGVKKAPPAAAPPPPVEEPPTPLAVRPSTRPGVSKLAGAKSGLTGPGGARPPALKRPLGTSSAAPSPARRVASPVEDAPPPPQPKLGLGPGRGLAGRPLGKPAATPMRADPDAVQYTASGLSGLSTAERAELEELRLEIERIRRENEGLRVEKSRLSSQIHELTNQNAQLIEDHTRDVLSIKAKETQLVRARSDAEEAQQMVSHQQREVDRLKRELSRQVRANSPPPMDLSEQIYQDERTAQAAAAAGHNGMAGYRSSRSFVTSPTASVEGKENMDHPVALRQKLRSPPLTGGSSAGFGYGGSGAPSSYAASSPRNSRFATPAEERSLPSAGAGAGQAGGAESWKRAAEVTQNLKARIEMMKAKQGLSRPH
ncbi:ARM repeat-containing protein [Trichodelitschia bisporula]|uniref:ARM repeat-containing protein n=1 Tax=Trichodelitschia bisporula TaxID=703511 RepID=A0A6G1HY28_9PEZI|nr:ARM repeat-containing protein [Trichodelitschia bisporula]